MRDFKPQPDYPAVAHFRSALRSYEHAVEDAARRAGLTMQRYLLLLMVKGAPSGEERATITDVAERLKVEPNSMTGAVGRAEEVGLVVREQCTEDRRRVWIRLTPEGERRLDEVVRALQIQRDELVATLESVVGRARDMAAADVDAERREQRDRR